MKSASRILRRIGYKEAGTPRQCSLINETTYGSVINACAYAAKVQQAECRFGKILKQRVTLEEEKYCGLINAFAQKV